MLRPAAGFLLALFVVANPAYFCPINCLLHHDSDHSGRHGHAVAMTDSCYPGPQVTPERAPTGRELSPAVPASISDHPAASREVEQDAPGFPARSLHHRSAPPPPPPRA